MIWAMAVALFWFSMRVIWSGISKVLSMNVNEVEQKIGGNVS